MKQSEQHPYLPSCEWEGFYTYGAKQGNHKMRLNLSFTDSHMQGYGSDDVGGFALLGSYSLDILTCKFEKEYDLHVVKYEGNIDENGIWGNWTLQSINGGFHIWPKGEKEQMEEAIAEEIKAENPIK